MHTSQEDRGTSTASQPCQHPCLPQAALQEAVQDGPQTKTAAGSWEAAGEPFI